MTYSVHLSRPLRHEFKTVVLVARNKRALAYVISNSPECHGWLVLGITKGH